MKKFFAKILGFIKKLYSKLVDETKEHIPTAIKAVEAIKSVMDSQADEVVLSIFKILIPQLPTDQINIVKNKLESALPKVILELNLINSIANTTDVNEQLKMILEALKLSDDDVKAEKYHTLASKILVILSDGKITWGESVMFTEWYYQTYVKK